jgi:hypothetical protein
MGLGKCSTTRSSKKERQLSRLRAFGRSGPTRPEGEGSSVAQVLLRRATTRDLPGILELQKANYVGNLAMEERGEGYLSLEFTPGQLEQLSRDIGVFVACDNEAVLGFLCAFRRSFCHDSPLIAKMLEELDRVRYLGNSLASHRSFIYGPVCIHRSWRGRGLLQRLYAALLKEVAGRFEVGVTFVAKDNPRSRHVHAHKLSMAEVGEFEVGGEGYVLLAFRVPVSAS